MLLVRLLNEGGTMMLDEPSRDFGEIEAWCRDRGVVLTKARRAVLAALVAAPDHPCAHEIHRRVSVGHRLGIATVYRALNCLTDAGILARHEFGDGKARYECAHRGQHPHLIDLDNGRIEKVDVSGLAELLKVEARRLGFRLVNYRLQMMVSALEPAASSPLAGGARPRAGVGPQQSGSFARRGL